jgi:hypothetical protein
MENTAKALGIRRVCMGRGPGGVGGSSIGGSGPGT